tara:strand:+ start:4219 stop:4470 length:252 start_codon:yes stop_codon:yes gene_type:complete
MDKHFAILLNDKTRAVEYKFDNKIIKDESPNAYEVACKLSRVVRNTPNPEKIMLDFIAWQQSYPDEDNLDFSGGDSIELPPQR